jgi:hypothetical protein
VYKVELDVHLIFVPPMDDNGPGIVMTRSFHLPFPPADGLSVFASAWEQCPDPVGLRLKDIVWDVEREVFLATSHAINQDFPIAGIAAELGDWVERGWRLGSYNDSYNGAADPVPLGPMAKEAYQLHQAVDSDTYEILHTLPPKRRPAPFNALHKALIRQMAESYNNVEAAYAMDKTGRYLGPGGREVEDKEGKRAWSDYCHEYRGLAIDDRIKWMRKVEKYPPLASLVYVPADPSGDGVAVASGSRAGG